MVLQYSAVWSNSAVWFGHLVVYFRPSGFYLFGCPVSAIWARLQKFLYGSIKPRAPKSPPPLDQGCPLYPSGRVPLPSPFLAMVKSHFGALVSTLWTRSFYILQWESGSRFANIKTLSSWSLTGPFPM